MSVRNVAIYVLHGNHVLVCRSGNSYNRGQIISAGGARDRDTPEDAAIRESWEESGLVIPKNHLTRLLTSHLTMSSDLAVFVVNYSTRPIVPGPQPQYAGEVINAPVIPGIANTAGNGWTWLPLETANKLSSNEQRKGHKIICHILQTLQDPAKRGPLITSVASAAPAASVASTASVQTIINFKTMSCPLRCGSCAPNAKHYCTNCGALNHHRKRECTSPGKNVPCPFRCGSGSCASNSSHYCYKCDARNHHRSKDCEKSKTW